MNITSVTPGAKSDSRAAGSSMLPMFFKSKGALRVKQETVENKRGGRFGGNLPPGGANMGGRCTAY